MILNGKLLTFDQECYLKEVNMRGTCMTMSADMEGLLLKIILYCIVDDPHATVRKFKGLMMGKKIEMAEADLKHYHPDEYSEREEDFKVMWEFNRIRRILAHCLIMWDEEEKSTEYFYYVDMIEEQGIYRMVRPRMTMKEVLDKIDAFKKSMLKMAFFTQKLIEDFNHKYPNFLNSSQV